MLEGKIALVTGAGRGIGMEELHLHISAVSVILKPAKK